jgi:hypothetical protein
MRAKDYWNRYSAHRRAGKARKAAILRTARQTQEEQAILVRTYKGQKQLEAGLREMATRGYVSQSVEQEARGQVGGTTTSFNPRKYTVTFVKKD